MPFLALALTLLAVSPPRADQTAMLQRMIDRCAPDGDVTFPAGSYSVSTLRVKPRCSYRGAAAGTTLMLRTRNAFILDVSERNSITITGVTFDGNNMGGAIIAQGYAPVSSLHVLNCRFTNVVAAAAYPANLTIFSSWGIIDSSFTGNTFNNVSGGISLTTVQNVTIANNTFTNVTQSDAVFIAPNPVSFPSGDDLRIVNNSGSGFAKIAVEIFRPDPPNGSRLESPLIENNRFSRFTAASGEGMGLSITHGENAIVRNNSIDNTTGLPQENGIGIEIIVRGARVSDNRINGGFGYGIAVQGTPRATLTHNNIAGIGKDGILFACDNGRNRCDSSGSHVEANVITEAGLSGIHLQNKWNGSRILNNVIRRGRGEAIRESTPRVDSVVSGNTVTQQQAENR